jgi:glycine cleavage system H protein
VSVPDGLLYSPDHEWVRLEPGGLARIGLTDYAQDALGDVVFVQLPEVGAHLERRGSLGEVESTKSVSDVYAPIAGVVREVNTPLGDAPGKVNEDPYGEGWLCVLEPDDPAELESLLDAEGYRALVAEGGDGE